MTETEARRLRVHQLRRRTREGARSPVETIDDAYVLHLPGGSWDRTLERGIYRTATDAEETRLALIADPGMAL